MLDLLQHYAAADVERLTDLLFVSGKEPRWVYSESVLLPAFWCCTVECCCSCSLYVGTEVPAVSDTCTHAIHVDVLELVHAPAF